MAHSIVFLGTSDFAVPFLEELIMHPDFSVKAVFTQPDKKSGRKQLLTASPVKKLAELRGIPVYQPWDINSVNFRQILLTLAPDYLITVAYGQILAPEILSVSKIANINAHASLLPRYRGAAPIQTALLNNDRETGVTIQLMASKVDTGDLLGVEKCLIEKDDTATTLSQKLSDLGSQLLLMVLEHPLKPQPQEEKLASYCRKISKEDGKIYWERSTAEQIDGQIRAFISWPGTYTFFQGKILKILNNGNYTKAPATENPGKVLRLGANRYGVQCRAGIIELDMIQLEGKKAMAATEFVRGHQDFVGAILA